MKSNQRTKDGLIKTKGGAPSYGLLAFLLPFLILAVGYATRLVFPFGDRHILTVDLYHQYAPFLAELREKMLAGDSLLYSFGGGLGVNFYALFAYYLASPLNVLMLLFPPAHLAEGVLFLTLIKVSLAGFTFNMMLRRIYLRGGPLAVAFSSMYALSSYTMAYSWNIMWLDGIYTMPVVIMAIVLVIRNKKYWLLPLSVAYLLIVNYYIAMFVLIFAALYFPVLLLKFTPDGSVGARLMAALRTLLLTLLGVGMSFVLIWPTYKSLTLTSAAGDTFPKTVESTFDLLGFVGQHFMLIEPTVRDGMPNMYAGILLLLLLPVYLLSSRVRLRERILNLTAMAFMVVSFNTNVLNFLWHGTHFPNQLPYRNSFVYIFLIIFVLYDALPSVKTFSGRELGMLGFAVSVTVLVITAVSDLRFSALTGYATILFIVLYTIILSRFRGAYRTGRPIAFMLLSVIFFEMVVHTGVSLYFLDMNEYFGRRDGYAYGVTAEAIRKAQDELEATTTDTYFFRTEVYPDKTSNDSFLYGLNGLTIFASTSPKNVVGFFKNMGFSSNGINSYKYDGSTLLMDAFFGIRYLIYREKPQIDEQSRLLRFKNEDAGVYVYENDQALSIGYVATDRITSFKSDDRSPFGNQNRFSEAVFGRSGDYLKKVPITIGEGKGGVLTVEDANGLYHFSKDLADAEANFEINLDTSESGITYFGIDMRGHKTARAEVKIGTTEFNLSVNRSGVAELGFVPAGEKVRIRIVMEKESALSGEFELYAARLDEILMYEAIHDVREGALLLDSMSSTHLTGNVRAPQAGMLLLSIPFDPGWTVRIDGAKTDVQVVDDCLMAVPVTAGTHRVEMLFLPVGLTTGLIVTLISVLVFVLMFVVLRFLWPRFIEARLIRQKRNEIARQLTASLDQSHHADPGGVFPSVALPVDAAEPESQAGSITSIETIDVPHTGFEQDGAEAKPKTTSEGVDYE
jgi:uncharacterized membrane protein YfhO